MKLSDLAKGMIFTILIIALVCILVSIIYYRSLDFLPFMLGVFLGTALSILKVLLLERAVDNTLKMKQNQARNYASIQHILRLFLTGVVLFLGAIVPQISLWGVVAGVFAFQISAYNIKFTKNKKS